MNESRAGLVFFVALILANCSLNPGAAPPGAASPGGDIIRGPTPDVAVERPGGDGGGQPGWGKTDLEVWYPVGEK